MAQFVVNAWDVRQLNGRPRVMSALGLDRPTSFLVDLSGLSASASVASVYVQVQWLHGELLSEAAAFFRVVNHQLSVHAKRTRLSSVCGISQLLVTPSHVRHLLTLTTWRYARWKVHALDVFTRHCTVGVVKRARSASLYHSRQCGIIIKPRVDCLE